MTPEASANVPPHASDREVHLAVLKAIAEPTRLAVLELLLERGDEHVSSICDAVDVPISRISHHLRCLENCGLVSTRREGKYVYYELNGKDRVAGFLELLDEHARDAREGVLECEVVQEDG